MTGKIILVPRQFMMDAFVVMERQNNIGNATGDRIIIGVGKDHNSDSNDFQFVAVANTEEIFNEIAADFKESLPEVYIQDQHINCK